MRASARPGSNDLGILFDVANDLPALLQIEPVMRAAKRRL